MLRCAEAASDHIREGELRTELMQCVHAAAELILDPDRTEHNDPDGYVTKSARAHSYYSS